MSVAARREEILGATRRVIGRNGFAGVTVSEVTREARVSLGLLHYHFPNKDAVVAEAFAQAAGEELEDLRGLAAREPDPARRLAAYLDLEAWADAENWRLWVDAWGQAVHVPALRGTIERFHRGWRDTLAGVLADGVAAGAWSLPDPEEAAARLVAALDGIGLQATIHPVEVPPERAAAWARRLVEAELGVTLPDPPAPDGDTAPARPFALELPLRRRDLDAAGRVDPTVVLGYLAEAREAWLAARLGPETPYVLARLTVEHAGELRAGDGAAHVRCGLERAWATSVRTRERVHAPDGRPIAEATALVTVPSLGEAGREALR